MPATLSGVLLITLGLSLLVQALFFVVASRFKTDKVTDLSYGLTFVILAVMLMVWDGTGRAPQLAAGAMVVAWGLRLAGYLFYRILRIGRDARFDGVRERFWAFAKFWLFQGMAVWLIMLPLTIWSHDPGPWNVAMTIGTVAWLIGFLIESVADQQKFRMKSGPLGGSRWMDSGLWRYSRHPNYFGELLCWWGLFLFVSADLSGWEWVGTVGPLTITLLLLFVTGIPTLEASAERKWGTDPEYQAYKRRTNRLLPWPPRTSSPAPRPSRPPLGA